MRSSTAKVIGWDFGGACLAEDIYFGLFAWSAGFTCDRIEGEVNELSPFTLSRLFFSQKFQKKFHTLGDMIKQRHRWLTGKLQICVDSGLPFWKRVSSGSFIDNTSYTAS